MTAPEISVVMSVYNGARTVERTLESVLAQQDASFEFVVIDDGSDDESSTLLHRAAESDKRLVVSRQENAGLTAALRMGCAIARGKYIARHDCGDISAPDRLATQSAILRARPQLAFVSCFTRFIGPENEDLWTDRGTLPDEPLSILERTAEWGVIGGPTHHGSVMIRKDAYIRAGGYRTDFYYGQDWDLWYRLAEIGEFRLIHQVLYTARVEADSISSTAREQQFQLAQLSLAAMRDRANESAILARARNVRPATVTRRERNRADGYYFIGEALRRRGDQRCRKYFLKAITARPPQFRSWLRLAQSVLQR